MLIDSSHPEETRVVVLDGQKVEEFDFEAASKRPLKGNIYLAKVTRVEPSLQAAFVEYGGNRQGFLAFSEIHPDYYQIPVADRMALIAEAEAEAKRRQEDEVESFEISSGPKPQPTDEELEAEELAVLEPPSEEPAGEHEEAVTTDSDEEEVFTNHPEHVDEQQGGLPSPRPPIWPKTIRTTAKKIKKHPMATPSTPPLWRKARFAKTSSTSRPLPERRRKTPKPGAQRSRPLNPR